MSKLKDKRPLNFNVERINYALGMLLVAIEAINNYVQQNKLPK